MKLYENIKEELYTYKHKSGLEVFVVPKAGYYKKFAAFATHYGSINNRFIVPGETKEIHVPDGIAHFLEHKLFEQEDGNVMEKFSSLGSQPNAYTSFNQTVYLFSCTDKFEENFKLLLNYVQKPYFTDESVENEKGIIGQEIRMYEDDPNWRVFFNLLTALYKNHPVKIDIAGTVESISKINKEYLYKCYNTFYHPSNMVITVSGDVNPQEIFDMIDQNINAQTSKPEIKRIFELEPTEINKSYIEQKLQVSTPLFQLGIKDDLKTEKMEAVKRETIIKCLLEMIVGRSSKLYEALYNEGLINNNFESDYNLEENYAYTIIGGESKEPLKVKDKILEEINHIRNTGLNKQHFDRIRKSLKGRALRQLNSVERISKAFVSMYFRGVNLYDCFEIYDAITFEEASKVFSEHFIADKFALSVIKPI